MSVTHIRTAVILKISSMSFLKNDFRGGNQHFRGIVILLKSETTTLHKVFSGGQNFWGGEGGGPRKP